jgi:hypothetical protein
MRAEIEAGWVVLHPLQEQDLRASGAWPGEVGKALSSVVFEKEQNHPDQIPSSSVEIVAAG